MKVLIIGSGGREHAIGRQLQGSEALEALYFVPGNPGTAQIGTNLDGKDTDLPGLLSLAKTHDIDLTIVGPEAPLVAGIVDLFEANNLPILGPSKAAAQIEGSKQWAKAFMQEYGIPTAAYEPFDDYDRAASYVKAQTQFPLVVKADGLAAGKGVVVAQTQDEALDALRYCLKEDGFAEAGAQVVIESFLTGQEASIFAFCDGDTCQPMVPAQDHKPIFDQDKGPNTGGMGAYSPAPLVSKEIEQKVLEQVFKPAMAGFKDRGCPYKGILYAGLMIDGDTVNVVEFNARFGDPETQVVLPRLRSDLLEVCQACVAGTLDQVSLSWRESSVVCVVMASKGYPGAYEKGKLIQGIDLANESANCHVIHAGTRLNQENAYETNGGRVLGVVAMATALEQAIQLAYEAVKQIDFDGAYYRHDIAAKALKPV
ncbi:MAG: phosphoribosylamine--glycine ligase [Actinobacteria bacterium]|nr:phosphoribosylamine--glycine ligase [Actinomycetota bacterium]